MRTRLLNQISSKVLFLALALGLTSGCSFLTKTTGSDDRILEVSACVDSTVTIRPGDWAVYRWYEGSEEATTRKRIEGARTHPIIPVKILSIDLPMITLTSPEWQRAEEVYTYRDDQLVERGVFRYGIRVDVRSLSSVTLLPEGYKPGDLVTVREPYPSKLPKDLIYGASEGLVYFGLFDLNPYWIPAVDGMDKDVIIGNQPPVQDLVVGAVYGAVTYPLLKYIRRGTQAVEHPMDEFRPLSRTIALGPSCKIESR